MAGSAPDKNDPPEGDPAENTDSGVIAGVSSPGGEEPPSTKPREADDEDSETARDKPASEAVDGNWDEATAEPPSTRLPPEGEATSVEPHPPDAEATAVEPPPQPKSAASPLGVGMGVRPSAPRPSSPGHSAELGARPSRARPPTLEDSDNPEEDPQTATKTRDDVLGAMTARTQVVPSNTPDPADQTTTQAVTSAALSPIAPARPDAPTGRRVPLTAPISPAPRPSAVTAVSAQARPAAITTKRGPEEAARAPAGATRPAPATAARGPLRDSPPVGPGAASPQPAALSSAPLDAAAIAPRPMPPGATADNLSAEDEDGPTMVVRSYPQAAPDDEATQVHAVRTPGISNDSFTPSDMLPIIPLHTTAQIDPDPLPVPPSGPRDFMQGIAMAQRQAAVDAALAAAMGGSDDVEALEEQRERMLELTTASILGLGLTLSAFAGYLSTSALAEGTGPRAASYGVLTVFGALALFSAGLATLQKRPGLRIMFLVGAALLLIFTLTRLIVIAAS